MSLGVESEQDLETVVVRHSEIVEVIDLEGYIVLLPCTIDAVNGYWTSDTAPICYKKLGLKPSGGVSFKIRINKSFSGFTDSQKLEAVGKIVSEWRPRERISLTVSNFTKEDFDGFVQSYLTSKKK